MSYILFSDFDQQLSDNPFVGEQWAGTSTDQKQRWYKYIIARIESHPWRGTPIDEEQETVFPFQYSCSGQIVAVTWDTDLDKLPEHIRAVSATRVLPSGRISMAVAALLQENNFQVLATLRNMGVRSTDRREGVEFFENERPTPLPEPLWEVLAEYSKSAVDVQKPATVVRLLQA